MMTPGWALSVASDVKRPRSPLVCPVSSHPASSMRPNNSRVRRGRPQFVMHASDVEPSKGTLQQSVAALRVSPVVLCVRMDDPEVALAAASAAIRGGLRSIEIALTTPDAPALIRELSAAFPFAHVGAGTVLSFAEADAAAEAGAKFAMSPVVDGNLIRYCNSRGMLAVPGAATPTEIYYAATQGGAQLVKVFPVNLYGGVDYVRALAGPLGHIPLLPTSGITLDSMLEYLALDNVVAIGASRQIFTRDAINNRDWDKVTENARVWAGKLGATELIRP